MKDKLHIVGKDKGNDNKAIWVTTCMYQETAVSVNRPGVVIGVPPGMAGVQVIKSVITTEGKVLDKVHAVKFMPHLGSFIMVG